jgi:hypothetical protein
MGFSGMLDLLKTIPRIISRSVYDTVAITLTHF